MVFWMCLRKTNVLCIRWALGLVTAAKPCNHQGQGEQIPLMISMFFARESCSHFLDGFCQTWDTFLVHSFRLFVDLWCNASVKRQHDDTTNNKWNERLENWDKEKRRTLKKWRNQTDNKTQRPKVKQNKKERETQKDKTDSTSKQCCLANKTRQGT